MSIPDRLTSSSLSPSPPSSSRQKRSSVTSPLGLLTNAFKRSSIALTPGSPKPNRSKAKLDRPASVRFVDVVSGENGAWNLQSLDHNVGSSSSQESRRVRYRSSSEPAVPNQAVINGLTKLGVSDGGSTSPRSPRNWMEIRRDWEKYIEKPDEMSKLLYREGPTPEARPSLWVKLSRQTPNTDLIRCIHESDDEPHECLYHHLLEMDSPHVDQITLDLCRTFPEEHDFNEAQLFNVLKAYSLYDDEVGYCQGLSFVAALLLTQVGEEQAFYILARLLKGHNLRSFYTESMSGIKLRVFQMTKLIEEIFPTVYANLRDIGIKIGLLIIPWFMAAFGTLLKQEILLRTMDVILFEGIPALFKIGLSLIMTCEEEIASLELDTLMDYFGKSVKEKFTSAVDLLLVAHAVNVSSPQLFRMEAAFFSVEVQEPVDEANLSCKKREIRHLVIHNYEMKLRLSRATMNLSLANSEHDRLRTRVENEKVVLVQKLGQTMDKMNKLLDENKSLKADKQKLGESLVEVKRLYDALCKADIALSEKLHELQQREKRKFW